MPSSATMSSSSRVAAAVQSRRVAAAASVPSQKQQQQQRRRLAIAAVAASSRTISAAAASVNNNSRSGVVARATAQQDKDAAVNESRWQTQVREGRVKSVSAQTAGELIKNENWVLLDVRPPSEVEKVAVKNSVRVPLYVAEEFNSLPNLMKHASWFGMGGWWLGGVHMKPNPDFMRDVRAAVPADAKVIVACQKGLRSLAAAEQLAKAGFGELAWINGGLDTASKGDLEVEGKFDDLRFGGIGGLSELLGYTDVQREARTGAKKVKVSEAKLFDTLEPAVKVALVVLALDSVWFLASQFMAQK